MNLLELMLKERVIFPAYAQYAVQDYVGRIRFADKKPVCNEKYYEWDGCWCTGSIIGFDRLANWGLDIVTRDQYQSAGGSVAIEDDAVQLDEPDFEPFVSIDGAQECKAENAATSKQSAPKGSGNPILGMVLADLTNRALEGKEKYGEPLKAHNGRSSVVDLLQELYDASMYCRQLTEELLAFGGDIELCISALAETKCLEGEELARHVSLLKSILSKNNALLAR